MESALPPRCTPWSSGSRSSWPASPASSTTRASSTGDGTERDAVLGILDVNGWHNLVHIASGAIGLAVVASYSGSRTYALGLGVVYLLVHALGFIAGDGEELFNLIPVNTEDNVLHLLIGIAGDRSGPGHAGPRPRRRARVPVGRLLPALEALLDVVRDAADRLLERLQAGGLTLLLLLAGSHQDEPAGGDAADDDRGDGAAPSCAGRAWRTAPSRRAPSRPPR